MALKDQLAKFQTWLQQNPDMKIKFKDCTQELIAVEKGSPSRSINPEIISVSKILREVVHDPMEVLVEQSRMKQEAGRRASQAIGLQGGGIRSTRLAQAARLSRAVGALDARQERVLPFGQELRNSL